MRVLFLGGAGQFGLLTARRLVTFDIVSEVAIAGRNLDALTRVASSLGEKAQPVQVDIHDEHRLASVAEHYDIVVNTAGPEWEVLLPALRGAITAGRHYCDIGAVGLTTERQLELDPDAKDREVVAIVGIGSDPGLDNLLAVHACRQFERVEELQLRHHWFGPKYLSHALPRFRDVGHVDMSIQCILWLLSKPIPLYRDGRWTVVDPLRIPIEVPLPEHGLVQAFFLGTSEGITLPRHLPGVRSVSTALVFSPPQLYEPIVRESQRIPREGLAPVDAAKSFLETIGTDPDRWLKMPDGVPSGYGYPMSVAATGWKHGRRMRYTCWPIRVPVATSISLAVAALRMLRGQIAVRGVLPPETCLEPMSFLEEMAQYAKDEDRDKPLLGDSLEQLS